MMTRTDWAQADDETLMLSMMLLMTLMMIMILVMCVEWKRTSENVLGISPY